MKGWLWVALLGGLMIGGSRDASAASGAHQLRGRAGVAGSADDPRPDDGDEPTGKILFGLGFSVRPRLRIVGEGSLAKPYFVQIPLGACFVAWVSYGLDQKPSKARP